MKQFILSILREKRRTSESLIDCYENDLSDKRFEVVYKQIREQMQEEKAELKKLNKAIDYLQNL